MGVFCNIVPSAHINNTKYDGLATLFPTNSDGSYAEITELFFTRNGTKFPIDFNINPLQREDEGNVTVSPEIIENYMNAIQKFADSRTFNTTALLALTRITHLVDVVSVLVFLLIIFRMLVSTFPT
jgi:hypothetical protein